MNTATATPALITAPPLLAHSAAAVAGAAIMARLLGLNPTAAILLADNAGNSVMEIPDASPDQLAAIHYGAKTAAQILTRDQTSYLKSSGDNSDAADAPEVANISGNDPLVYSPFDPDIDSVTQDECRALSAVDNDTLTSFLNSMDSVESLAKRLLAERMSGGVGTVSDIDLGVDDGDDDDDDDDADGSGSNTDF
jgi:hypothetical protein